MIGWRKLRIRKDLSSINSNAGWYAYYVARFNKTEHPDAAQLAMFYLFLALRDGEIT
jgi:hypothetical protein